LYTSGQAFYNQSIIVKNDEEYAMADMTKRERVLRAIRFEETDRIPTYDIFQNDAVIEQYSNEILTTDNGDWAKGIAIGRILDMTSRPVGPRFPGIERRPDGLVIQQERWTRWVAHRPFEDVPGMEEWIQKEISSTNRQQFGSQYREQNHAETRRYLEYFAEGDPTGMRDAAVLAIESSVGLMGILWYLGSNFFLTMVRENSCLIEEWLDARFQAELRRIEAIADRNLFPVVVVADDVVTKSGIAFSLEWLQQHWFPKLKRVVDAWHEHHTIVMFRSEGNIMQFLPDLTKAGIDGISPLEDMPIEEIRNRYPKLFLAGGIDANQLLAFGMPDAVRKACRDAIIAAGRKGYFLGSNGVVNWEAQVENVAALYASSGSRADRPAAPKRRF
jgi:uroporphyrinogen decarboxylase